ncbi:hypothetical protein IE81DRAFT_349679 [Ceraceosorus guamensis]|uniref:Uncharacterized protein n=1 Tax=Ceraceosorus guamensis TaxID=1522189 RepID=A0A316VU76_9BASI|nr:hypothetical protein IE81DRAFT_349679 [Ceraceosorus guamensis]PWN39983.1 hypothetical protein IE81DRAFT_349679 [Ceraceosorus guamensis]
MKSTIFIALILGAVALLATQTAAIPTESDTAIGGATLNRRKLFCYATPPPIKAEDSNMKAIRLKVMAATMLVAMVSVIPSSAAPPGQVFGASPGDSIATLLARQEMVHPCHETVQTCCKPYTCGVYGQQTCYRKTLCNHDHPPKDPPFSASPPTLGHDPKNPHPPRR